MFFNKPVCPVCGKRKKKSETQIAINLIEELFQSESNWFVFFFKNDKNIAYKVFTNEHKWACDLCLDSGTALNAQPSQQTFCDYLPYLAYLDSSKDCRTCKETFIFAKEEKLYWYETLGFWVQSDAVNCKKCRKQKRAEKEKIRNAQERLSQLLPVLDTANEIELREVINLYELTNSTNKVREYTGKLKRVMSRGL